MAIIEWSADLSVGIDKMDEQHLKLFEIIQELDVAVHGGDDSDLVENTLVNLFNYAQVHFATEEEMLRNHHYPEEKMHELEHRKFIAKAFEFREKLDENRPGLNQEIVNFLSGWILSHIQITDKRYARHLKAKCAGK